LVTTQALEQGRESDTSAQRAAGIGCGGAAAGKAACFEGIGWKIRLQQKRTNYFLTLAKEVVLGNALKKGDEIFYYLADCEGRKALLVFLDGSERPDATAVRLNGITFMVKR
jgi:hypothetical protein